MSSIFELHPTMRGRVVLWLEACKTHGVEVLVYCTYRSEEEQAALYAIGRTVPGRHWKTGEKGFGVGYTKTNAEPGTSWHNFRRALDAVPMVYGKPDWSVDDKDRDGILDEPWWRTMVEEGEKAGLEWAGRWKTFREFCHFQYTGGLTFAQAREEARK